MNKRQEGGKDMKRRSYMRAQGSGYIVGDWDSIVGCYRESHEMPYFVARAEVGSSNCTDVHCRKPTHTHCIGDVLISGEVYLG